MKGSCEVRRWDGLRWNYVHTKFHDGWFKLSSIIKVLISTIWEAAVLVTLTGWNYEKGCWYCLRWHTTFYNDRLRHSSHINVTASTILEDEVLVLLIRRGEIYEVSLWNGLRSHDIHTKIHDDRLKHLSNIEAISSAIWEAAILVLLLGGICEIFHWDGSSGMIHTPSFIKISSGFQKLLRRIHTQTHT
jgi:hypothetical protein